MVLCDVSSTTCSFQKYRSIEFLNVYTIPDFFFLSKKSLLLSNFLAVTTKTPSGSFYVYEPAVLPADKTGVDFFR